MSKKRYKLLKNTPSKKAGSTITWDEETHYYYYDDTHETTYEGESEHNVENNTEWFEEIKDESELYRQIAERVSSVFHYGDFKPKTMDEMLLESLLIKAGLWPTTEDEILERCGRNRTEEWKVLQFVYGGHSSGISPYNWILQNDGLYYNADGKAKSFSELLKHPQMIIFTVCRLSDGEVFNVGDAVDIRKDDGRYIRGYHIINFRDQYNIELYSEKDDEDFCAKISDMHKSKKFVWSDELAMEYCSTYISGTNYNLGEFKEGVLSKNK